MTVSCSGGDLEEPPAVLPPNTVFLDLSNNRFVFVFVFCRQKPSSLISPTIDTTCGEDRVDYDDHDDDQPDDMLS